MDKMKPVFQALNKELIQENLTLTIICVGGYVLEYHGLRATQDVDAFMAQWVNPLWILWSLFLCRKKVPYDL
ncbi:Uncharacterised protein [Streptococcus pneumoniae]|uniref:Uncharacterized protein n=1 Tax=Streptococcus pneumoniae TaxID=1313 RepID=A0A4J2FD51_STREE|nr:hypothetical protein [Streptococcus pneumoniae]MDD0778178.1 hypothetical protein [Streptococcus pneumoniae]MDS2502731.1 hypothetical protein [Streptococcus pneumoniae]MDS3097159.1 hypothetical protein [Streptococcus pneumoniae]MDS3235352.1 hypothetical protein [Streptococcus pneumoniae]MDS4420168.1 hypothetical protein [Streptococcus pneumoniae]